MEKIKKEYTSDLRLTILENSLFHEHLITKSLGDILNIEIDKSYSLSDKSSSLSLAAKINLLIDLKSLSKEQKPKLIYYLEIRNQFLHNWLCKSFTDCFQSLESNYKALKKLYNPNEEWSSEEQMTYCYNSLSNDIVDIAINHLTMNVINVKAKREIDRKDLERYKEIHNRVATAFVETIESKDFVEKYDISNVDKMYLIREFIDKIF